MGTDHTGTEGTDTEGVSTEGAPAAPAPESVGDKRFDELQHEIRLATRSSRYALATAVAAAMVSAGVSAWASVHVSGTQMDRQERLAREQAIRTDREKVYTELVSDYLDFTTHLGVVRVALTAHPAEAKAINSAISDTQTSMTAMAKTEATVKIVGSDMGPILNDFDAAELALFQGPNSLLPAIQYVHDHDPLTDDARWAAASAPAVAAIDRFVADHSIDELADRARADLGSG